MDLPNEHVTIWEWNSTVFAYASLGAVGSPIARDHHHVRLPPNLIETRNLEEIPFKFQVKPTASLLHPLFTSSFRENNPQIK